MGPPPLEVFLATIRPNKPVYYSPSVISDKKEAAEVRREGGINGVGSVVAMTVAVNRISAITNTFFVELRHQSIRSQRTLILTAEDEYRGQQCE